MNALWLPNWTVLAMQKAGKAMNGLSVFEC